jgi:molecular chaperone GrpE
MVNEHDNFDDPMTVTDEEHHEEQDDIELADEEENVSNKLKQLRQKITNLTEEKQHIQEAAARERADFLNAKRRIETERAHDKVRYTAKHIEKLLPLCDSFELARADKETWEKADEQWRKGIEGIHTQLTKLVESYGVHAVDPLNETFDPYKHEAIGTTPVTDPALDNTVVTVLQKGYELEIDGAVEVIRPARVTTGTYQE